MRSNVFPRFPLILLAVALLLGAQGCAAPNMINLKYTPMDVARPCATSITVVKFADERGKEEIGEKRDGTAFYPVQPVGEWVSKAFFEELKKSGCAMNWSQQDFGAQTEYVLTGTVREMWLRETSLTELSAEMTLNVRVTRGGERVYEENLSSRVERTKVPASGNAADILEETLKEIVRPALDSALRRMGQ